MTEKIGAISEELFFLEIGEKYYLLFSEHQHDSDKRTINDILTDQLPKRPTILDENSSHSSLDTIYRIKTLAKAKKEFGLDVVIGFQIETNLWVNTEKTIKFGIPGPNTFEYKNIEGLRTKLKVAVQLLELDLSIETVDYLANSIWRLHINLSNQTPQNTERNCFDIEQFEKNIAGSDGVWHQYLKTMDDIDVSKQHFCSTQADIEYLRSAMEFITGTSDEEFQLYVWWKIIEELAWRVKTNIMIYAKNKERRSFYCAKVVNNYLPMLVAHALVDPTRDMAMKRDVEEMWDYIVLAFIESIEKSVWMDTQTKYFIIEKVKAMKIQIGYPDWILDENELQKYYGPLDLNETQFLANTIKMQANIMNKKLESLKSPADLGWPISPTEFNAINNRAKNTISKFDLLENMTKNTKKS